MQSKCFGPLFPLGALPICPARRSALECFRVSCCRSGGRRDSLQEEVGLWLPAGRWDTQDLKPEPCLWAQVAGEEGAEAQFSLFHIICPPPLLYSFLCAFTSPVLVEDKVCGKPRLALKAAAKGEKFSISSISSIRDFFPSHLVTAVFRKITGLMVLLPGVCMGVIRLGEGGRGWSHTGKWAAKGQLCRERAREAGHLLCSIICSSRAGKWHRSGTASCTRGLQWGQRAPQGWVLAHPRVEEGTSGSSLIWGQLGAFLSVGWDVPVERLWLCCGLTTEVSPPPTAPGLYN